MGDPFVSAMSGISAHRITRPFKRIAAGLSEHRLRVHGLILAFCLWSVYLWNMATPGLLDRAGNVKGTEFLHLYTLGSLALAHRGADLYNMGVQAALVAQRVPQAAGVVYLPLYPPQVSLFVAPWARLSYGSALLLWLVLNSLIYGLCCYQFWRACPHLHSHGLTVLVLAIAFPAFWHLIAWGQTSALALACFTAAYFAIRARREFLAGLALGCLIFKPQLAIAAACVFFVTLRWRIIVGGILSAAAELTAPCVYYGAAPLREWMRALINVPRMLPQFEPRLYQTHSLRSFWAMLAPWPWTSFAFYLVSAILVIALTISCWKSDLALGPRYSVLLLASVLIAPHLTVYDLVILAPAFLLLSNWLASQPVHPGYEAIKLLLYLAYFLPLAGPLARWTHLQPSVPAMAILLYGIWNFSRGPDRISTGRT
jgi:Glycosyltransferase family 87